ncbi:MAG: hypothetical protein ACO3BH_05640 [Quisquiliibacterium sp.]
MRESQDLVQTILKTLLMAALLSTAAWAHAACDPRSVSPADQIRTGNGTVLLVTHASSAFDPRMSTKTGLDAAIRLARQHAIPTIYLKDDAPGLRYFMDDCAPDHWAESEDGEIRFSLQAQHVLLAGGHLELCLSRTMHDILEQWAKQTPRNLRITLLMDAIYSNGKAIDPQDDYYDKLERFLGVVTHGRPGGEAWPKLTLLETMGVIARHRQQRDYLRRVLPHYARTMPSGYRVEMRVNDEESHTLVRGAGSGAPTLSFHFIDSALQMAGRLAP